MKLSSCKIVFVLGGVFSGIGKGIVASSIGKLLKHNSLKVSMQKYDPYLNVDCGLLSPFEHGEVFVTHDGLETDLDLGSYERFLNQKMSSLSSVTSGKLYQELLQEERQHKYRGRTINIYDVANKIKNKIFALLKKEKSDCLVVELGGTIGDNDLKPFLIAAAQLQKTLPREQVAFVFLVHIYYLQHLEQFKTKPAQNAVASLRNNGIEPDFVILRSSKNVVFGAKKKFADACYLPLTRIFTLPDVDIYSIPQLLYQNNFFNQLTNHFQIKNNLDLSAVGLVPQQINELKKSNKKVTLLVVSKYVNFKQSYFSLYHAIYNASIKTGINFEIKELNSEKITEENFDKVFNLTFDGVLIPGGFGKRGILGKILTTKFVYQNKVPFLGICLGFQTILIAFARDKIGLKNANSEEFVTNDKEQKNVMIIKYFDPQSKRMIIGQRKVEIVKKTLLSSILPTNFTFERFRNRLIFDKKFIHLFADKSLIFSGFSTENGEKIPVVFELTNHPFFIGVQFHPEFNSSPEFPHPLLTSFLESCWRFRTDKK